MSMNLSAQLSDCTHGTNNNFNVLRLGAAIAVVLSHSFILTYNEPNTIPRGIGYLAVNCFFIISGFLICKSALAQPNIIVFYKARILRIFPALCAAVFFSALIVGPLYTELCLYDYFSHSQTYEFITKNITLIFGIEYHLPGVFKQLGPEQSVNAPLWTLVYELYLYFFIGVAALITLKRQPNGDLNTSYFYITVFLFTLLTLCSYIYSIAIERFDIRMLENFVRFSSLFGIGAMFYLARKSVLLSPIILVVLIAILLLSSQWLLLHKALLYPIVAYVLLYLAYIPKGMLLKFNRLGDYSYGVYIFAYPIQQSIANSFPVISTLSLFLYSFCIALVVAVVSWHCLEHRALQLKN